MNGLVGTICAALISLLAVTPPSRAPVTHISSIEPLATGRLTRLRRGINASHWFAQVFDKQGYTKAHFDTHTTAEDISLIKRMGFDHIRFGLEIAPLIYNFHFYEPHLFTHQGATWGWEFWRYLKLVPYPSSADAVAAILPTISNQQLRAALVKYGEDRWEAARIDRETAEIAAWAKKHNVYVTCNEFGWV